MRKIVGIEIREASRYLNEMGFDPEILEDIKESNLIVTPKKDFVFIGFQIIGNNFHQQKIPVANIPMACMN